MTMLFQPGIGSAGSPIIQPGAPGEAGRELSAEEVRKAMAEMAPLEELKEVVEDTKVTIHDAQSTLDALRNPVQETAEAVNEAGASLSESLAEASDEFKRAGESKAEEALPAAKKPESDLGMATPTADTSAAEPSAAEPAASGTESPSAETGDKPTDNRASA